MADLGRHDNPLDYVDQQLATENQQVALRKNLLRWLLHCKRCLVLQKRSILCPHIQCRNVTNVVRHMESCKDGRECQDRYCVECNAVLTHFMSCVDDDCRQCHEMKRAISRYYPDPNTTRNPNHNLALSTQGRRLIIASM